MNTNFLSLTGSDCVISLVVNKNGHVLVNNSFGLEIATIKGKIVIYFPLNNDKILRFASSAIARPNTFYFIDESNFESFLLSMARIEILLGNGFLFSSERKEPEEAVNIIRDEKLLKWRNEWAKENNIDAIVFES